MMENLNNDNHVLGMTIRSALSYFDNLFGVLIEQGVSICGNYDMRSGDGITSDDALSGDGSIEIGMSDLKFDLHNFFGYGNFSDHMFVRTLVSVFHELRHADIFSKLSKQEDCPVGICLSHMSRQGSNSYYISNRYCCSHEIDAEFRGVMGAYHRLCVLCNQDEAEHLICDYVNWQCEYNSYYIGQNVVDGCVHKFVSVDEISDAFFEAYELATSNEPVVRINGFPDELKKYHEIRVSWNKDESLSFMINEYGQVTSEFKGVFDMMWDASNSDKDRMMASLALHAIPDLRDFYGDAICDSLSVDKVFGDVWPCSKLFKDVSLLDVVSDSDVGNKSFDYGLE